MNTFASRTVAALAAAASFTLLLACSAGNVPSTSNAPVAPLGAVRPHASLNVGVVIPMYIYPGNAWNQVIAQKKAHPNVPILLIADITNTGVGNSIDPNYVTYIAKERAAGVKVIGYVATNYYKPDPSFITASMNHWYAWYRVDGIFLDEANPRNVALFTSLTSYAHKHNLPFVMANPGQDAPANLGPDVINFYEQKGYPSLAFLRKPAHVAADSKRWSYIAEAAAYNPATIAATAQYVSYLYAVDAGGYPSCYCKLPTYFAQLMTQLATLDGG